MILRDTLRYLTTSKSTQQTQRQFKKLVEQQAVVEIICKGLNKLKFVICLHLVGLRDFRV